MLREEKERYSGNNYLRLEFLHLILECLCLEFHMHDENVCFQVCGEKQRFEKLMEHFRNEDNNIDFMVSYFSTTFNKGN